MTQTLDVFFDATCPFAWLTSRWALEAEKVRDVKIRFRVMSLAALNEGRDLPADYRAQIDDAWGAARLALAIDEQHTQEDLSAWYTAWGEHYHVNGERDDRRATAVQALAEANLPAELIEAYDSDAADDRVRAAQKIAQDLVGDDVGTPVVSFGTGTAYFGPVVMRVIRGEEAGKMFDALSTLAGIDGFYEMKRSRTGSLDFS